MDLGSRLLDILLGGYYSHGLKKNIFGDIVIHTSAANYLCNCHKFNLDKTLVSSLCHKIEASLNRYDVIIYAFECVHKIHSE